MKDSKNYDFDIEFNNMMSSAIRYEQLKKAKKPIPAKLKAKLARASKWLNNMSDEDYNKLIH